MFWNEDFLDELRNYIADKIVKLQYRVDDDWSDAQIAYKDVRDGKVILTALITAHENFVVSGIRLVGGDEAVLAQMSENITKGSDVLTMQWEFPLYEIREVKK